MDPPNLSKLSSSHEFLPYTSSPPPSPSLRVLNDSTWTYCGPLLPLTPSSLPSSFDTWTNAIFESPSTLLPSLLPFLSYVNDFLRQAGLSNYWITVRASLPTHDFDTPRWHTDDLFFDPPSKSSPSSPTTKPPKSHRRRLSKLYAARKPSNPPSPTKETTPATGTYKLCTTLLGPSTLFLSPSTNTQALAILRSAKQHSAATHAHPCTSIRCLGCATAADAVRQTLATSYADLDFEVVSPARGECCWFRLGTEEGAVHSEPACGVEAGEEGEAANGRVFVNVVPGTEEQLRGLVERWGMAFPRAWSVGTVDGLCVGAINERGL